MRLVVARGRVSDLACAKSVDFLAVLAPPGVAACAHATKPTEMMAVAPPGGSAALAQALGADVKTDGAMSLAWSHPTAYKPWASGADSVLVLNERGGDIDVLDVR